MACSSYVLGRRYFLVTRTEAGWQLKLVRCCEKAGLRRLRHERGVAASRLGRKTRTAPQSGTRTLRTALPNGADGYYRFTPSNYVPTGENYYYRCVASYLIRLMASRLALAMLHRR